uniref:Uncharacterized protein n=1 Tax=Knipowitschia caucasica TaxID=637954 RepID=A0AAV2M180_KNICA
MVLRSFEVVVVLRSFEVVVVLRSFEVVEVLRSFEVVEVLRSFDVVEWAVSWSAAHSPARSRAHNFNPGAGWSSLPGQMADPFPYRAELDLPVPQRRNCSPTPTKKEHRGPSRLKPPPGFPGSIPAPCSRVWERLECVRPLSVREED